MTKMRASITPEGSSTPAAQPPIETRWGCAGKAAFANRDEALSNIRNVKRVKREGRGRLTAYRCRFCTSWHIGSLSL